MQTLHAAILSGTIPIQYPIIQSMAANQWIDVNNESAVTLTVGLGGRQYLIPPNTTARYAMDNTETFVQFTPNTAANGTTDTVSGTIYNEQDATPIEMERGANASDILPITSAMIADGAVIASKVATAAINTANIVPGAVTNPILAALAVANSNIQSGAVANAQLANGSVSTNKIANLSITNALIANAAVGTAQIANAAITTALIANLAVTDALISSVSASKITAGTITATISMTSPIITGGVYQTDSSGRRISIDSSVDVSRIRFFTGIAGEVSPAYIYQVGGNPSAILIAAPFFGGVSSSLQLNSDATGEFIGTVLKGPTVTNVQGAAAVGPSGPWATGAWTGIGSTIQINKRQPSSSLLVMFAFSVFTSSGGPINFGILGDAGNVASTIRSSQAGYTNPANTHTPFIGFHRILGGAAAGTYALRIAVNSSVSYQADANDYSSLTVIEVGP